MSTEVLTKHNVEMEQERHELQDLKSQMEHFHLFVNLLSVEEWSETLTYVTRKIADFQQKITALGERLLSYTAQSPEQENYIRHLLHNDYDNTRSMLESISTYVNQVNLS